MTSNKLLGAALVVLLLLLGAAIIADKRKPDTEKAVPEVLETQATPVPALEEGEASPRTIITRETVEGMYYGLKSEDAETLFGSPADEIETEYEKGLDGYTAPYVVTWHIWHNADGSLVRLGFVNGKMDRKQFISADGAVALPEPPHVNPEKLKEILE